MTFVSLLPNAPAMRELPKFFVLWMAFDDDSYAQVICVPPRRDEFMSKGPFAPRPERVATQNLLPRRGRDRPPSIAAFFRNDKTWLPVPSSSSSVEV